MTARPLISLLAAALVGSAPAGASARNTGGWIEDRDGRTVIHLKIFELPDPTRTDASTRAEAAIVRAFVKEFPRFFAERYAEYARAHPEVYGRHNWDHVSVEPFQATGLRVEKMETDLLPIAGGMAPDVLYVNFRKSDTYIRQNFLYPLDKPGDGYFTRLDEDEKKLRIHPKILPVMHRAGPGGKHVWAMPYGDPLGRVMTFRKDLFDAAGLPYPTADWTWDDLLNACRKLTDPARGTYGCFFGRNQHESWYWITFLWSAGGEVMSCDEARDEWRIDFDSPRGVEALDFYTRLCTEPWTDAQGRPRRGYVYKDSNSAALFNKWLNGEIAISLYDYIDERFYSTLNPDVTGVAPVPKGPHGDRGAELNSKMMGIFAGVKERAVRDAAWEYIRFYQSREAIILKTRILAESGLGRFINPAYLELAGLSDLHRTAPPGWNETFRIALETGKPEPHGRNSNMAYNLMTEPIAAAYDLGLAGRLTNTEERIAILTSLLKKAGDKARRQMLGEVPPADLSKRRATAAAVLLALVAAMTFVFRSVARSFTQPTHFQSLIDSEAQTSKAGKGRNSTADSAGVADHKSSLSAPSALSAVRTSGRFAACYALLAPAILTILVWQYWPLLRGSFMAFQDYRVVGDSRFTGLDNFGEVLWSADWWRAVFNSLRYSLLVVALTFLPPVVLAILLQEVPRGRILFRTLFYLPAVISGLVVMLLWKSFYEPSERGVLNAIVLKIPAVVFLLLGLALLAGCFAFAKRLRFHGKTPAAIGFLAAGALLLFACHGLAAPALARDLPWWKCLFLSAPEPYRWLISPETAMIACVIPMAWAGLGPGSLIYQAALKGIADDLYEAADMDGATFTDKIMFIVFPMLKPLLIINFVGVFIGAWLHASANILAMTGGSANTEVADLHIFYEAFLYLRFGPATAMAWVLAFILIGFTVYQLKMLSRLEFRTTDHKNP